MFRILLFIFLLMSCTSTQLDESDVGSDALSTTDLKTLRSSLKFTVDNKTYEGIAMLQRKAYRRFQFHMPENTYIFMLRTCNGKVVEPNPGKSFSYDYSPIMGLENMDSCYMDASAITKKGEEYRAIIDFTDGNTLPATLDCNRETTQHTGAAICQSEEGLTQRITFEEEVVYVTSDKCPALRPGDWLQYSYEVDLAPSFCIYKFMDRRKRKFRLTTYGYTTILHVLP